MEATVLFIEKVKEEVPGIVLENCASGGHRLEPKMMSVMSMASFSDAHECEEIPIIAVKPAPGYPSDTKSDLGCNSTG